MYTHKNTFSLSEADNQSGSPLGFLQTFDRFYTTRILRQVCKSLSFNDSLSLPCWRRFMLSLSDGYCRQSEVYLIRACRDEISSDSQVLSCSGWFSFRICFIGSVLNYIFDLKPNTCKNALTIYLYF